MASGGYLMPPSQAGTYRVMVSGGGAADTATVTVGGTAPPVLTLNSLSISPKTTSVATGGTQQFSVAASWSDGSTTLPAITWSATGGTISSSGRYTAGSNAGTFRVVASGGGKADTATVAVSSTPVVTQFSISPKTVSLSFGGIQQFQTSTTWSDGVNRAVSVTYTATGGGVLVGGLFTAAQLAGTFSVIATCSCGRADTATVMINGLLPAILTSLTLNPRSSSLTTGGTQQFQASALWSNGGTTLPTLSWSATGGTVSQSGVYSAGSASGTYRVIVSGGGRADTASVSLSNPIQGTLSAFLNSAETGCSGTDPNVLLCEDFESGTWYDRNCDQMGHPRASNPLPEAASKGWCGTIYNDAGM